MMSRLRLRALRFLIVDTTDFVVAAFGPVVMFRESPGVESSAILGIEKRVRVNHIRITDQSVAGGEVLRRRGFDQLEPSSSNCRVCIRVAFWRERNYILH